MIEKYFQSSFKIIDELLYEREFDINQAGLEFMTNKKLLLEKQKKQFEFKIHFHEEDRKYFNDILFQEVPSYSFASSNQRIFYAPEKSTLLLNFHPTNDNEDNYYDFDLKGSLIQIMTVPSIDMLDNKYHRLLIPLESKDITLYDFRKWGFKSDSNLKMSHLIKVSIKGAEFHLFHINFQNKDYWGVDSTDKLSFREFQTISFSILNAYGFLKGDIGLGEAFYISADDSEFSDPQLFYSTLRDSIKTGYAIFTTNAYSVHVPYFKRKKEDIDHEQMKQWNSKLPLIEPDVFSRLCQALNMHDALSRAVLIILEANTLPLELKAASYCVAYESICHTIKNVLSIKSPSVIDEQKWSIIKPLIAKQLMDQRELAEINDDQLNILSRKLDNWNQPTNRDTLTAPFKHFEYELNEVEFRCIDNRNKFLHGSLPFKIKEEDEAFRELYFISLTLHKLACILILKFIGFGNTYIVNYPKMHEHITGKPLDEGILIKI